MNNLEAKQEAIKKTYGEHWEYLKNFINEDGVFIGDTDMISDKLFGEWAFIGLAKDINSEKLISGSRPKSLKGIENNNGWIRIESEADLPKLKSAEELNCFIKASDDERIGMGIFAFGRFMTFFGNEYANVTHYQPIEKPKPPIY